MHTPLGFSDYLLALTDNDDVTGIATATSIDKVSSIAEVSKVKADMTVKISRDRSNS